MGLGSALFILTIQFWLARVATPENRAQLFSYHQVAGITGSALGPAIGGAVAGWLSWRYSAGLAIITGLMAAATGRRLPYPTSGDASEVPRAAPPGAGRASLAEILGPGVCMMALMFFHGGVMMTLVPLFAAREVHLGPAAIGGVLMLGTVQRFGAALVAGRLATRFGTRNLVVIGLAALGLSVFSFVPVTSPVGLILAVSLVSWANAGGSFVIAMITNRTPEAHWGTVLGMNRTLGDAGAMTAPILVGLMIDRFGFEVAFAVMAGVLLVAAALASVLTAARVARNV